MELFTDVVFLSRLQFLLVVVVHFLFVPMSVGLGLIVAIHETKAYRSGDPSDQAGAHFWVKLFTATFAVGVATGITMEFSFGTNWADYSRFVGDIFGSPLAAEALSAFFLESTFLGVLLFGRNKVSPKFYMVSSWLVAIGSCLSALWILIANSWMQTPAGYEVIHTAAGDKAILTDFFAAAINYTTGARYFHTVDAAMILGGFIAVAVGVYVWRHGNEKVGKTSMRVGLVVSLITLVLMAPAGHLQAEAVADYQPSKFAALEGQWETGPTDFSFVGYVDEEGHQTIAITFPVKGFTSFLASWDFETVYPGLDSFDPEELPPINITFQFYHLMIAMFMIMALFWLMALILYRSKKGPNGALGKVVMFSPLFPVIAIQSGWMVTEFGRQPWIVYQELLTKDAYSSVLSSGELITTIILFVILYAVLIITYLRIATNIIKKGPDDPAKFAAPLAAEAAGAAAGATIASGAQAVAAAVSDNPESSADEAEEGDAATDSVAEEKEVER